MHLWMQISVSINPISDNVNINPDISAPQHVSNMKEIYCSSHDMSRPWQMHNHHDKYASLDYMMESLPFHAL